MSAEKVVIDADLWQRVVEDRWMLPGPLSDDIRNAAAVPVERWQRPKGELVVGDLVPYPFSLWQEVDR